MAEEVGEKLLGASQGEPLVRVERDPERQDLGSILGRLGHLGGERAGVVCLRVRTRARPRGVLGDLQAQGGQIKDLTVLLAHDGGTVEGAAAGGAGRGGMHQGVVGVVDGVQSAASMSMLGAGAFAALGAQVGGLLRFVVEALACGGLAAVVAILVEAGFELVDARTQESVLRLQGCNALLLGQEQEVYGVPSLREDRLKLVSCQHIYKYEVGRSKDFRPDPPIE